MPHLDWTESCPLSPPAPCAPTHLTARVDCQTGITVVTWDPARGATSYTVYARGSLGHNAECNSTDTNCDFRNLACGQDYTITVLARHDTCVSVLSESINATTGNKTKADQLINCDYFWKAAYFPVKWEKLTYLKAGCCPESAVFEKLQLFWIFTEILFKHSLCFHNLQPSLSRSLSPQWSCDNTGLRH